MAKFADANKTSGRETTSKAGLSILSDLKQLGVGHTPVKYDLKSQMQSKASETRNAGYTYRMLPRKAVALKRT